MKMQPESIEVNTAIPNHVERRIKLSFMVKALSTQIDGPPCL
jgi:hypothetical protein